MLLVHISDIHYGPMLKKNMLRCAIHEINDMHPDVILVTGDIAEDSLLTEFI